MKRPRILDLFCGAGGCSVGYSRAGFEVVGVDVAHQPRYPFEFHRADALEYLTRHGREFDAIHASPPCQLYSSVSRIRGKGKEHPDLVGPTRELILSTGRPYVIENVAGSPVRAVLILCGSMFGLSVRRHRLFETSHLMLQPDCRHRESLRRNGRPIAVYGHPGGGATPNTCVRERKGSLAVWKAAMGIDWMTAKELAQAIPPAYTHYVGLQLRAVIDNMRA